MLIINNHSNFNKNNLRVSGFVSSGLGVCSRACLLHPRTNLVKEFPANLVAEGKNKCFHFQTEASEARKTRSSSCGRTRSRTKAKTRRERGGGGRTGGSIGFGRGVAIAPQSSTIQLSKGFKMKIY